MRKKYRRHAILQTFNGVKPGDIGVRLALYFLRKTVLNMEAEEATGENTVLLPPDTTTASASYTVICNEFLKALGRTEIEQPMICFNICACAQLWRYQHYLLPRWEWGVNKIVCFGLGSFRNVKDNGGPFDNATAERERTYRDAIRDAALLSNLNTRKMDRHDALQAMLRHIAAIEMASMMTFCSSKRGVEHHLIKHYFKKLSIMQDMVWTVEGISEKKIKKLEKSPPTAGYGGDEDLTDIPVYFHDPEYTEEDKDALECLSEIMEIAHLPPIQVVDEAYSIIDEHTLVYAVDPDFPVRSMVMATAKPAAMIWRDHGINPDM